MNKLQFTPFPTFTSDRLIMRQLNLEDANSIFNYQSDKNNFPHVEMTIYQHIDEAIQYMHK